jgi:hypothetical protein
MTFFADLTPYTNHSPEKEQAGTVNIGWLDRWHPFPIGETSDEFRAKVQVISLWRVNQTRGFYPCTFCKGRDRPAGSAEIRVVGKRRVYAAPILVHHYVAAHWYRPPEEFIAAVLAWDASKAPDPERAALELALALQPKNLAHAWRLWSLLRSRYAVEEPRRFHPIEVERLFRLTALTSAAGAAAFANAYHEVFTLNRRNKPRSAYVDEELGLALERAARKLQGENQRRVKWVLQCVAPTPPKDKKGRHTR